MKPGRPIAGAGALLLAAVMALGLPAASSAQQPGEAPGDLSRDLPRDDAPEETGGLPGDDPFGPGAGDAPVISAPDDPSRTAPGMSATMTEAGTLNSFTAGDALAPPAAAIPAASLAPIVVEMFTSQGCSSCPPADAMLAMLAAQPDVLALSYHVDYWDYLGWADSFARPEFTRRQEAYARAAGERAIYTPQIIVDGHDTLLAPGPAQLNGLVDAARFGATQVTVRRDRTPSGETIELTPLSDLGGRVEILMVRYAPERRVEVTAGENRGRHVSYTNVVLALEPLARWDGTAPLRLTVRPQLDESGAFPDDTRHALLVQAMQMPAVLPGPILAAIRLD